MNNRLIILEFQGSAGWKAWEMAEALDALPHDTEIVGFDRQYGDNRTFICLRSERFAEVPNGQMAPAVVARFHRNPRGDVEFTGFVDHKGSPFVFDRSEKVTAFDNEDGAAGMDFSSLKRGILMFGTPSGKSDWLRNLYGQIRASERPAEKPLLGNWKVHVDPTLKPDESILRGSAVMSFSVEAMENEGGTPRGDVDLPRDKLRGLNPQVDCNCAYEGYKFHTKDCPAGKTGPAR